MIIIIGTKICYFLLSKKIKVWKVNCPSMPLLAVISVDKAVRFNINIFYR